LASLEALVSRRIPTHPYDKSIPELCRIVTKHSDVLRTLIDHLEAASREKNIIEHITLSGLAKSLSLCSSLHKNTRSLPGGVTVSTEPDWSSFTLPELLEQAGAYGNKASSGSLRTSAFL